MGKHPPPSDSTPPTPSPLTGTCSSEIVQQLFLDLHRHGLIQEDSLEQLFCEHCSMFLADRYVEVNGLVPGRCCCPGICDIVAIFVAFVAFITVLFFHIAILNG